MAKAKEKERKKREVVELSEVQKQEIADMRKKISDVKYRGTIKNVYPKIRKGTVAIYKSEDTELIKKENMIKLFNDCIDELEGVTPTETEDKEEDVEFVDVDENE